MEFTTWARVPLSLAHFYKYNASFHTPAARKFSKLLSAFYAGFSR